MAMILVETPDGEQFLGAPQLPFHILIFRTRASLQGQPAVGHPREFVDQSNQLAHIGSPLYRRLLAIIAESVLPSGCVPVLPASHWYPRDSRLRIRPW